MAIQKHILVLHQRKRQNANAIWIMILGCLSLCCFTSLCLLFNDWSLLPQAYNPKPLILGDALFDLNPDLFPIHQAEIGSTKKQNVTRLMKNHNDLNNLHRVRNDGGGHFTSLTSLQQRDGDQFNTIVKNRGMTNSASRNENIFGLITVLMRKRSTNNVKRPSLKMQKSLSLGTSERKEMKNAKERKTLIQAKETQSQPSSPSSSSNSVEHMQVDIKPILKSGSKKRFRPRERVSFAVNERIRHIRDRSPPNKNVLYAADGQMKTTLNHVNEQNSHGLVKRSGLPPLHPSNKQDAASASLSAYPGRRRTSRSPSPASSNRELHERLSNANERRRASFNDVHDIISRQSVAEEPLSQYQSNWKGDKNSQARISRLRGRVARTPSPPGREHVIYPSHTLSPFHEKKEEATGTSKGRRRSFDRVASWLDKLGEEYSPPTPSSPSSPFAEAQRSSLRSKDSTRRHRVSFEGIDEDRSIASPRIVSIRHEGPSEGLKDVLQKRSLNKDAEMETDQMMKRCFGSDCLSFLKSKVKSDDESIPLRSQQSFHEEKTRFSSTSQTRTEMKMTAPQRQAIHSSTQRKQSPFSSANGERDLRKYTLIKNTFSPFSSGGAGIKVTKRAFSDNSVSSPEIQSLEHPNPKKSILRSKDRSGDEARKSKHVTFSDETKFTPSSNRPRPRSRLNSRLIKQRISYEGRKQVLHPSSSSSSTSKFKSLPTSIQNIPSIEINHGSRRGYVSSNARFTSKQAQRLTNIARRSERTERTSPSIDSEDTLMDNDNQSGSTLRKRASIPTKPSLRPAGKQKDSSKRVQFKEVTKADIHELPESPRSPGSHGKQEYDMFATKPVVLHDASKQHQSTPITSTSSTSKPNVRSSTISTPSSTSKLGRFLHAKHGGGGWMNGSYSRGGKFKKRDILEKRGQKRKSPLRYVASSESFIHTNDHHAKFGSSTTTSAVGPTKKMKQQQQKPKRTSSIASDLSPSHLGFAGLHINSNSNSQSVSAQKSNSASMTNTSNQRSLLRSDSLRSTGSSSFRGSVETDSNDRHLHSSAQTNSRPSSVHAQRGEWWHSAHSGTSSGSGVPFVYK